MPTAGGSGTTFFATRELEQAGVPILAGIYGTNPAGGATRASAPPSFSPTRMPTSPSAAAS